MSRTQAIKEKMDYLQKIANVTEELEQRRSWYVEFADELDDNGMAVEKDPSAYEDKWNSGMVQIYDELLDYLSKKAK